MTAHWTIAQRIYPMCGVYLASSLKSSYWLCKGRGRCVFQRG